MNLTNYSVKTIGTNFMEKTIDNKLLFKISCQSTLEIKPNYSQKDNCIVVYSPSDLTIRKRQSEWVDLKFDISYLSKNHNLWINPAIKYKGDGLAIIDNDRNWISNKTKFNTVALHLFNKSHFYDIKIKKNKVLCFILILGKKDIDVVINYEDLK